MAKQMTVKQLLRLRREYADVNGEVTGYEAVCKLFDASISLARRLSKLERAGKATPERKSKYPVMEANSDRFSVDVIVKESDTLCRLIGYWDKLANSWWVYTPRGAEQFTGVESWQYITDPATTPPTVALSAWVSVKERLPEIGKLYRNLSNNVLVYVEGYENAERIYIGFYNYSRRTWEVVGRSDIHTVVIKWQPLPDAP